MKSLTLMPQSSEALIVRYTSSSNTAKENSLNWLYNDVAKPHHEQYLKPLGVKLPGFDSQAGVSLALAARGHILSEVIEKGQYQRILHRLGYPTSDGQDLRHFNRQYGWDIQQYRDMNISHPDLMSELRERVQSSKGNGRCSRFAGYYLASLTTAHRDFVGGRRAGDPAREYLDKPCVDCGSRLGDHRPKEKGGGLVGKVSDCHADPEKSLYPDNFVILCDLCNCDHQNRFIWKRFNGIWMKTRNPKFWANG